MGNRGRTLPLYPLSAIRDSPLPVLFFFYSLLAIPYSPGHNRSTIVTFAMPPPSHMVCRP